jgi:hypothetical protein
MDIRSIAWSFLLATIFQTGSGVTWLVGQTGPFYSAISWLSRHAERASFSPMALSMYNAGIVDETGVNMTAKLVVPSAIEDIIAKLDAAKRTSLPPGLVRTSRASAGDSCDSRR